ncbi:MAG: exosortase system-associated protein, TIGR04073 family [Candidatus Omnitrophota bacterium]
MKKIVVLISLIAILFASSAYADTMLKKLGRGAANIITCPLEIPYRIGRANEESGPFAAFTWGILDGFCRTAMRFIVGGYEVISFPIPFPPNYEPIIDDPEFFLEEGMY